MEKLKKLNWKHLGMDVLVDIVGGILIAIGVYNFASAAEFPMAGLSGIALIFYYLFGTPIGIVSMLLNIPIAIFCYKILGRDFFIRSIKSIIITSFIMDEIAPLFPYRRGETSGGNLYGSNFWFGICFDLYEKFLYRGADFIMMSIKAKKPHLSLGKIVFIMDALIIAAGAFIYKEVDGIIYGMIVTYLLSFVVDKVMYGIDAGKLTMIVTEKGDEVAQAIDNISGRGSTLLRGVGSYSKEEKQVVMRACNNKQMYAIRQAAKQVDEKSFIVIMESNEVVGEGFKED